MNEDCWISDAEWQVMRVVWTLGQANSSEIIEQLAAKCAWSPSTVKTLLRRLEKKDFLLVDRQGPNGQRARQHDDDRDYPCKRWAVNEKA